MVHVFWDREVLDDVVDSVDLIATVHVGNLSSTATHDARWSRAPVGDGVVPLAQMLRGVHDVGYRGPYENEARIPTPDRTDCVERVRAAREWFDALWDEDSD